jgi:glutathione synthase/RimK-type ligase-like ATP-grasp enzyme
MKGDFMKKHVVIFEVRGGTDKGPYGFRPDSRPIIDSLMKRGWSAEIIFYRDEDRGEIYRYVVEKAGAYISRVNPGNLYDETGYFQMLRELVQNGVEGLPHPNAMINYGAKNSIERLKGTSLVPEDVVTYYDFESFKATFPTMLKKGVRVLKQNRGSTGEGIWRVEVLSSTEEADGTLSLDSTLKLTEAKDNHVEEKTLGEFIDFCVPYLDGPSGMMLDMPFLPRIKEGEIRVFMLRREPVWVVHKKPAEEADAFSATLFSGANYTYQSPNDYPELILDVKKNLDLIIEKLGGYDIPLIWTLDFILDDDALGGDKYVLGEINASCVGFTTQLSLSDQIADEVIRLMEADNIINQRWTPYNKS